MGLALFDFDGTITDRETMPDFMHEAVRRHRLLLGKVILLPLIFGYKACVVSGSVVRAAICLFGFWRVPAGELEAHGLRFAQRFLPGTLRPEAMDRITHERTSCMLGQLLDQVREYYLSRFTKAIDIALQDASVQVITEATLLDANGRAVPDGMLSLPLRNDLVVVTGGGVSGSQLVDTEGMLSFAPITFRGNSGLEVALSPFQWNWLELRLHGLLRSPSWSPLAA